jgi:hypothetical protein
MLISESDRATIRSVVEQQLQAFQKDDAAGAFAFASPGIQQQFRTAENFMHMVKIAYQAVYRPRSVLFENLATVEGIPAQPVLLLDSEGIPSEPFISWKNSLIIVGELMAVIWFP